MGDNMVQPSSQGSGSGDLMSAISGLGDISNLTGGDTAQTPSSGPSNIALPAGVTQVPADASAANKAPATANNPGDQPSPAVAPNDPHARLATMVAGLFEGMNAFGRSLATHGREGGATEVQQYQAQQQQMKLQQQQADQQKQLAEAGLKHTQALTNMTIAQTEINKMNAPVEHQKLVIDNQAKLYDLFVNTLHVNPMFAVPIIEGQSTEDHTNALATSAKGDLVNNTVIPVHDEKVGGSGNSYGFSYDQLRKVNVPVEQAGAVLQNLQNQVDYARQTLPNGDKDPAVLAAQGQLNTVKSGKQVNGYDFFVLDNMIQSKLLQRVANNQAVSDFQKKQADAAKAQADATKSTVEAQNAPLNQKLGQQEKRATIAKTGLEAQKTAFEFNQEKREADQIGTPDTTGFASQLTPKEYDKRYDAFTKSKQFQTSQTMLGSYQQFQDVVQKINSGQDMTGADSVVALFNAIGISATPLAGKGFRINESTVSGHTGARGIDQAAYQKLLSLKNGDVITPQQVKDYASIAANVYKSQYVNLVDEAHRQGLPADFLPQGGGRAADPTTIDLVGTSVLHSNPGLAKNPAVLKQKVASTLQGLGWNLQ